MINKKGESSRETTVGPIESSIEGSTLLKFEEPNTSVKILTPAGTNGRKRKKTRVCVNVANGNGSILHERSVAVHAGSAMPRCQLRERASLLDSAISRRGNYRARASQPASQPAH